MRSLLALVLFVLGAWLLAPVLTVLAPEQQGHMVPTPWTSIGLGSLLVVAAIVIWRGGGACPAAPASPEPRTNRTN